MSDYEKELEQRIEDLENLWFDDTDGLAAISDCLTRVMEDIKKIEQLVIDLQNPASSANKHGDEVYQTVKEKIISTVGQLSRSVTATNNIISNIRNLK